MKIKIWADYSCPFCYIGKTVLQKAIDELELKDVEIEYKAFLLDPNAPLENAESTEEALARKYRVSRLEAKQMMDGVVQRAKREGLHYRYDLVQATNTKAAHRLLKFVRDDHKQALNEALYRAYFIEGKNLSNAQDLAEIAKGFGVVLEDVQNLLASNHGLNELENDLNEAQDLRISGVPFFLFEDGTSIKGAQPMGVFIEKLAKK
jgi:predicted DsbA family dithiol-disulfide isomerase